MGTQGARRKTDRDGGGLGLYFIKYLRVDFNQILRLILINIIRMTLILGLGLFYENQLLDGDSTQTKLF